MCLNENEHGTDIAFDKVALYAGHKSGREYVMTKTAACVSTAFSLVNAQLIHGEGTSELQIDRLETPSAAIVGRSFSLLWLIIISMIFWYL